MASSPRPRSSNSSTHSDKAPAKPAVQAQRARTKRGLHQPTIEAPKHLPTDTSAAPTPVADLSDVTRDDILRRELQDVIGRSPSDRHHERLSAANEDGVLEEDDPDVPAQRRTQSIDEQTADLPEEDLK